MKRFERGAAVECAHEINETSKLPWTHLRLPPFSQVALRVLQLANKENVQLHELSELISSDPAFASEVLTIVNSLAYAPRFPISSILQAIAVMGANHLQGLCLTVGVRSYLGRSLSRPSMRSLWRHNLACAAIAEQLASTGFLDRDIAFTCGVMHDIGRLALAVVRPGEYAELLGTHAGPPESILEREREAFGRDHCEMGRQLVADWRLPEDFEPIVAQHHAPRKQGAPWGMAELIHVSCRMADAAGFAAFPACRAGHFSELVEELPIRERGLFYPDIETLTAEISRKISAIEAI
jgi:putative nucleotidyltransferase with HDIG domain